MDFNNYLRHHLQRVHNAYSPQLSSNFKATVTQHLLQGAGIWVNKRFIYQAINDRRITDSSFRQQILYTVNQVETIYWGLVQAYEDVQAKQRALEQSTKLDGDNRKQLEIGTMAPLDVVKDDSTVATDKQSLISSQSALNYQQQIIKQAIARNLNDPALSAAPVIPTDRVTLEEIPEEKQPVEELVQEAFQQQAGAGAGRAHAAQRRNHAEGRAQCAAADLGYLRISIEGSGIGGSVESESANHSGGRQHALDCNGTGYGDSAAEHAFNNSAPDKGVGFNVTDPHRQQAGAVGAGAVADGVPPG